jgi:hypothetical protein
VQNMVAWVRSRASRHDLVRVGRASCQDRCTVVITTVPALVPAAP